jgi:hypothetical protein
VEELARHVVLPQGAFLVQPALLQEVAQAFLAPGQYRAGVPATASSEPGCEKVGSVPGQVDLHLFGEVPAQEHALGLRHQVGVDQRDVVDGVDGSSHQQLLREEDEAGGARVQDVVVALQAVLAGVVVALALSGGGEVSPLGENQQRVLVRQVGEVLHHPLETQLVQQPAPFYVDEAG